jgi:outer membrane protein assembly factor BamA
MQFSFNDTIKKIFLLLFAMQLSNIVCSQNKKTFLNYEFIDFDSSSIIEKTALKSAFNNQQELTEYLKRLPNLLLQKGFPFSSVDTVYQQNNQTFIHLYLGEKYQHVKFDYAALNQKELSLLNSKRHKKFNTLQDLSSISEILINYYENNGFPFASVTIDSISFSNEEIHAKIKSERGVFYKIDSIHVEGSAKIKNKFLSKYLHIQSGSPYSKEKLRYVDKKISELSYIKSIQSSDVSMLGTGASLNLYLQSKKNSQFNFLIGLQPASVYNNKFRFTGDLNLDLKNSFGQAENIVLRWQQLQPQSPRLNIRFVKPYIFGSQFDFDGGFELFKKDSSFLQINSQLGMQFSISNNQLGRIFMQWQKSNLLSGGVDTNKIKSEKRLPNNIDVSINYLGLNYQWNNTNYKFNPRKGNDLSIFALVGIKKIKKNEDVLSIKETSFNYSTLYDSLKLNSQQIKLKINFAHYFPIGLSSTFKAAINLGSLIGSDIFRNELYQIGGFNLLRGFDEESIYAKQYEVLTFEYRLLFGSNSFISLFSDIGNVTNSYQKYKQENQFYAAGLGFLFETKVGVLNLFYAVGKRNDIPFNLRESSKIHFGYINYF